MPWLWTASGPTERAIELLESNGGPLSSGERVMVLAAWAFWNSAEEAKLADVVYRLDDKNLHAVATLMLALAHGAAAIDEWITAMNEEGERDDGAPHRRPSLRAGRLSGRPRAPR
jgi:hypothetical protein